MREFLTIDVPNGWEDVKTLSTKVLEYQGREFVFTGWNSDHNHCYFARPIDGGVSETQVARIKRRA